MDRLNENVSPGTPGTAKGLDPDWPGCAEAERGCDHAWRSVSGLYWKRTTLGTEVPKPDRNSTRAPFFTRTSPARTPSAPRCAAPGPRGPLRGQGGRGG